MVTRFGSGTVLTWGSADMNDSVRPEGHPPCVTSVMNKVETLLQFWGSWCDGMIVTGISLPMPRIVVEAH
jgi:hypothetical protein